MDRRCKAIRCLPLLSILFRAAAMTAHIGCRRCRQSTASTSTSPTSTCWQSRRWGDTPLTAAAYMIVAVGATIVVPIVITVTRDAVTVDATHTAGSTIAPEHIMIKPLLVCRTNTRT